MRMAHTKTCGQCVLMQHNGGICPVFKTPLPHDNPGCIYHTLEINPCALCGNHMTKTNQFIDVTDTENIISYCGSCKQHINHCPTCSKSKECLFETDPSPLPKIVQQEIRQGNMIQVMTVKNPERVKITCSACPCYYDNSNCHRDFNFCQNYHFILDTKQ